MDDVVSEVYPPTPTFDSASPFRFVFSPTASPALDSLPQTSLEPLPKRQGRKRSSRACISCRVRKVRCNAVGIGVPCSNCRHDEIECILPLSRRQRSARERAGKHTQFSAIEECSDPGFKVETDTNLHDIERSRPPWESISARPGIETALSHTIMPIEAEAYQSPFPVLGNNFRIPVEPPPATTAPSIPSTIRASDQTIPILPQAFTAFPHRLSLTDLLYLRDCDALTIPRESLQIELLQAYVDFVHGIMPVLDLEQFLSTVTRVNEVPASQSGKGAERQSPHTSQISLLLFQAVMFAGVEFVSLKVLKEAGYRSREAAHDVFFRRVKLLYDFDTSIDRISIIQSLLLMTLHHSPTSLLPPNSHRKDPNHYLNLAISNIYALALHRIPPLPMSHSAKSGIIRRRKLQRRIFWTTFCRDIQLAISPQGRLTRPLYVRKHDCDIAMLSLEDFDLVSEGDGQEDIRKRRDAQACVDRTLLCWYSNSGSEYGVVGQLPIAFSTATREMGDQASKEKREFMSGIDTRARHPRIITAENHEYTHLYGQNLSSSGTPSLHSHSLSSNEEEAPQTPSDEDWDGSETCEGDYGVCEDCDRFLQFLQPMTAEQMDKPEAERPVTGADAMGQE